VAQVVDLTARRSIEERFRLLFESSPLGMDIIDVSGRMVQANPALARMLGYEREELLELRFEDFTHSDDFGLDAGLFAEMLAGKRPYYELDKRCVRKDGRPVLTHLTAFALPDPAGTRYAIGILEDVTERRVLEEQLRQSQRMEAVGQLAGGVAHDFNNLLTAIASYCDLASDALAADADARLSSSLDGIRGASDRAADLTRQLLAFSRQQVLEMTSLDLNAVVAEHAPMLRRLLGEDVSVRLSLDADVAVVTMDAGQLGQVLMNLAVNARDAMEAGGTLTIETENVELDHAPTMSGAVSGRHVLLAVSDTGCGMDADTMSRIFEPFFTTKEAGRGTGLGLSTVLGIVEQSGGRVSVYSEPGVGTTFKIYMPSTAGPVAAPARAPAPAAARPAGSERVLLVEDNDAVRGPIVEVLRDLGYAVDAADGPDEALRLADGAVIDLLVTDVVMPSMNGRQLAELLVAGRPDMKVLYISGYTDDAVIAGGAIAPGTAFLQKPFGADRFAEKIRELLDA
ncbi:MAG TPA: PAS domain S-box protein, partial [Gaiellaceae bacterium]|nr:PAS domain S-box protein [Gaiellaceae bacterium]